MLLQLLSGRFAWWLALAVPVAIGPAAAAEPEMIVVRHLTGPIYVIEDNCYFRDNSVF